MPSMADTWDAARMKVTQDSDAVRSQVNRLKALVQRAISATSGNASDISAIRAEANQAIAAIEQLTWLNDFGAPAVSPGVPLERFDEDGDAPRQRDRPEIDGGAGNSKPGYDAGPANQAPDGTFTGDPQAAAARKDLSGVGADPRVDAPGTSRA